MSAIRLHFTLESHEERSNFASQKIEFIQKSDSDDTELVWSRISANDSQPPELMEERVFVIPKLTTPMINALADDDYVSAKFVIETIQDSFKTAEYGELTIFNDPQANYRGDEKGIVFSSDDGWEITLGLDTVVHILLQFNNI